MTITREKLVRDQAAWFSVSGQDPIEKAWLDGYAAAFADMRALVPHRVEALLRDLEVDADELKKAGARRAARRKLGAV
jgi:hypothetical protein